MKRPLLFVAALAFAACTRIDPSGPAPEPAPEPTPEPPDTELIYPAPDPDEDSFLRVAYFPSYEDFSVEAFPDSMFNFIDVACYAFTSITDECLPQLNSPKNAIQLIKRCHEHGVKVELCFGGEWLDKRYVKMSGSANLRKAFVDQLLGQVKTYGFDGVNNDWEYPSSSDGSQHGNLLLMRELSNALHAPGVGKTLSMAINCGKYQGSYTKGIDRGVFDCCDWFASMCYDDDQPHSPFSLLNDSFNYWVYARSMPAKKFVGGMPCYGRGTRKEGYWNKAKTYRNLVRNYGADPDADEVETDGFITNYNGRRTIERKVEYLVEMNTGGYFFWEAGQDMTDTCSLVRTAAIKAGRIPLPEQVNII